MPSETLVKYDLNMTFRQAVISTYACVLLGISLKGMGRDLALNPAAVQTSPQAIPSHLNQCPRDELPQAATAQCSHLLPPLLSLLRFLGLGCNQ